MRLIAMTTTTDMSPNRRSRLALGVVGLLLLAGATQWILHSGSTSRAASQPTPDAAQIQAFKVLRDTPTVGGVPSELDRMLDGVTASGRVALVRGDIKELHASDGTGAWIIPGRGSMCFAAEDGEGIGLACGSTEEAISGRLAIVTRSAGNGNDAVIGLAPDAISQITTTTKARPETVGPDGNLYVRRGRGIQSVRLARPDGVPVTIG